MVCLGGGGGQTYKSKVAEKSRLADQEMLGQLDRGEKITRNAELDKLILKPVVTNNNNGGIL